jgi:hypothetical protein
MSNDWRNDPATEKQMGKLRFFGCTWDEGITKGQAADAIQECVKQFPDIEKAYQNRPATPAQMEELQSYFEKHDEKPEDVYDDEFDEELKGELTYGKAKELIESYKFDEPTEQQKQLEYDCSEDGHIDAEFDDINFHWADRYREVTRDEVVKAWALVKSRKGEMPETMELLDALEELFTDFRQKPGKPGVLTSYCLHCREPIEIKPPKVNRALTREDIIYVAVQCPHCGRDTTVFTVKP